MNRLLGEERAIVAQLPGQRAMRGHAHDLEGLPITLHDTAGIGGAQH